MSGRPFDAAAPIVAERFDSRAASSAVEVFTGSSRCRALSMLERVAATPWFRPCRILWQGRLPQSPLRYGGIGVTAFGGTASIEGACLLGVAARSLLQLRHRRPQSHNFRMNRSVRDKVQVEPTAAGRLSWC